MNEALGHLRMVSEGRCHDDMVYGEGAMAAEQAMTTRDTSAPPTRYYGAPTSRVFAASAATAATKGNCACRNLG
jgi:hypothetical protein